MAVVLMIMAQQTKTNQNNVTPDQVKPMLYDFLGMKSADSSPVVLPPKPAVSLPSPSPSVSFGASSSVPGPRGPISSTSDLASERQAGNHLEGVPFYGTRSDISGPEISNRLVGSKRSNSESAFMGHEYSEGLHLMKLLRNGAGGEKPRRSNDDEVLCGMQQLRPTSASLILQPSANSRMDPNVSRWERTIPINTGSAAQYHPRGGQLVPFMHQVVPNRFKDANAGPLIISQSAADEGSRTGIKGPDILSSVNVSGGVSEKNSSSLLQGGTRPKSGSLFSEPESSTPPSRQGLVSASRQMTIFYGGQAHVFDDVHPNKMTAWLLPDYFQADVIMALAGSNGGSWSTTYSPKSTARPVGENLLPGGDPEAPISGNMALPQELRGRLSVTGNTSHGSGSGDRILTPPGFTRNLVQAAEPSTEEKRDK
ncbi:protein TIFY 8 isoform X2 [Mangifera indica]|uniref:protein TIFY 8 isoform X2 n=1 Tax=Mangifera indica TaxID=29780 RepID=UPI001CFA82B3|nr:protein TIFY 8 isoform X2 [Mangifera indica]